MDFEDQFDDNEAGPEGFAVDEADMFMFGLNSQEIEEMREMRDSVIFLIDCHKPMHDPNPHNEEGESNIGQIMHAVTSFLKTKVITSDQDKIGIILYGCKTSKNAYGMKNITALMPLDGPDAAIIKMIE